MKPTTACLAAFLWFAGHTTAVARSRSSPVLHGQQLRGETLSAAKFLNKGREEGKPKDDNDTLTHELIDQATTQPRNKKFKMVDKNGDGKIDYWEYIASTRAATRIATYRFNCTDDNLDQSIDVKEFEAAQAAPQEMDRCMSMLVAFQMVDKDRNGYIAQDELWSNVGGPDFDSRWAFMIACSDLNGDGKVSPMEFSKDMYGCMEEKSDAAYTDFTNFTKSDQNGDGCADEAEMEVAVNTLFGINLISNKPPSRATKALTRRWMSCVDFDSNQCLTKEEYVDGLLNPTPAESQCIGTNYEQYEADMDFEIMDTNNDGKISRQEYYAWCSKLDIEINQQDAESLFQSADANNDGFIQNDEFDSAGANHKGDGPGALFFLRSTDPARSIKTRTAWQGSLRKTWTGLFKRSA